MSYDPDWLRKEKHKAAKPQTHVEKKDSKAKYGETFCGLPVANGKTQVVRWPSEENLPTCPTCRELFLETLK